MSCHHGCGDVHHHEHHHIHCDHSAVLAVLARIEQKLDALGDPVALQQQADALVNTLKSQNTDLASVVAANNPQE